MFGVDSVNIDLFWLADNGVRIKLRDDIVHEFLLGEKIEIEANFDWTELPPKTLPLTMQFSGILNVGGNPTKLFASSSSEIQPALQAFEYKFFHEFKEPQSTLLILLFNIKDNQGLVETAKKHYRFQVTKHISLKTRTTVQNDAVVLESQFQNNFCEAIEIGDLEIDPTLELSLLNVSYPKLFKLGPLETFQVSFFLGQSGGNMHNITTIGRIKFNWMTRKHRKGTLQTNIGSKRIVGEIDNPISVEPVTDYGSGGIILTRNALNQIQFRIRNNGLLFFENLHMKLGSVDSEAMVEIENPTIVLEAQVVEFIRVKVQTTEVGLIELPEILLVHNNHVLFREVFYAYVQ